MRSSCLIFLQGLHLVSRGIARLTGFAGVGHLAIVHVGPDTILSDRLRFRREPLLVDCGSIAVAVVKSFAGTHAFDDAFALTAIHMASHGSMTEQAMCPACDAGECAA